MEETDNFLEDETSDEIAMENPGTHDWKKSNASAIWLQVASHVLEEDPNLFTWLKHAANLTSWDQKTDVPVVVDAVIRCFGWQADLSLFDHASVQVKTTHGGKYPH